ETTLKSDYTRRIFEQKLVSNIRKGLKSAGIEFEITAEPGRIFVKTKKVNVACDVLKRVFGLVSISPVKEVTVKADIGKLVDYAEKFASNYIKKDDTFAVRAKRTGNDAFTSQMIERRIGARIVEKRGSKVNLTDPDKILYVEVRQNKAYFFREKIKCPGGLPLGTQGNVVALFSGGIDSAVAAWMMMKRGCKVFPLYIDCSPFVESSELEKVKSVFTQLKKWSIGFGMKLIVIKNKALPEIVEKTKENLTCLLCKRMMYRIAEKVCEMKEAKAIVTGENLGQVASQTLDNLYVLDHATHFPVIRPLIGLNKEEIVELAKEIGTYEASISKRSSCSAVPSSPRTKGRISEVEREEGKLDVEKLVKESMKTMKIF
ncbi:MAG TPA: tRNA 4-thiouridine(8) synthase ThiI, partial [Candidatus Aenigmarchaeota archaeon]|nr:tRNA 4-thiouridine(8) synthase ThiI [Candidatus Aenigmarchaeota archaeon]